MAKGVNMSAVDVCNGSIRADAHVTRQELNADHRSWFDPRRIAEFGRRVTAARDSLPRIEPECTQLRREMFQCRRRKSRERHRRGDLLQPLVPGLRCRPRQTHVGSRLLFRIDTQHLFNRPDSCDRFFRKGKSQRDRSCELAININGRSTHALHYAGVREGSALETAQNNRFLRPDIFENSQDFHLKFLDPRSGKNRAAHAVLACADVLEWKDRRSSLNDRCGEAHGQQADHTHSNIVGRTRLEIFPVNRRLTRYV
jgi:hypothetical protein